MTKRGTIRLALTAARLGAGLLACLPVGAAPSLERITLTVTGEELQYDHPQERITARGQTEIRGEMGTAPDRPAVLIRAGETTADLGTGRVEAAQGVEFIFPGGLLAGERLELEAASGEFLMPSASALLNLAGPDQTPVLWRMEGQTLESEGGKVFVRHGMLTPYLEEERAPLSLRGRRVEYDPQARRLRLHGGQVDILGVRVPLLFRLSTRLGDRRREATQDIIPVPRWTSREGLVLPYSFELTGEGAAVQSDLSVNLTTRRGILFRSESLLEGPRWEAAGYLSRAEFVPGRLTRNLVYNRLPELQYARYQHDPNQDGGWQAGVSLGNFRERLEVRNPPPPVSALRGQLSLGYAWGEEAWRRWEGQWGGARLTNAWYQPGGHYGGLEVYAGAGARLTPWLRGNLTALQQFTTGQTPFRFDAAEIETELRPALDVQVARDWRLQGLGRWDAQAARLRNYSVELTKRMRYLTWGVHYDYGGNLWSLRLYINGLSPGVPPPPLDGPQAERYLTAQEDLRSPQP